MAITWSPDGKYVACGGQKSLIVVWNATTGERLTQLEASKSGDRIFRTTDSNLRCANR